MATTETADLFLLEDLEDAGRTTELDERDRAALHAVANWIKAYVIRPHEDLGREGPVCPYVVQALERRTLWLAPERIGDRGVPEVVALMDGYKRRFLETERTEGEDGGNEVIVVVFTDLAAERAQGVFDGVRDELAARSYADDGIIFGPFYEGNPGTAIYNTSFRPFQSPVPFLFVRRTIVNDWKFFVDDDRWLGLWARRFGESGARALGEELRRLPWRAGSATGRET